MAESKSVTIVPLNGSNYPTRKVQCRMALMKDGLWGIVNATETPEEDDVDKYIKFVARRDHALALIVLSIKTSFLYLIGDPDNPINMWKKLADQFQKKTWANKLELRRKLYSLHLKEGDSVQDHIRAMTEIFEALAVISDPVTEKDRVVHLLASLPDSFNMLVIALEANADVPEMEVVTERLLNEERKMRDKDDRKCSKSTKVMTARFKNKSLKCHYCGKIGHIKRNCFILAADEKKAKSDHKDWKGIKHKANKVAHKQEDGCSSSSEFDALVTSQALTASESSNWIVDSGVTCHMCNDDKKFATLQRLRKPQEVMLGDGHVLEAIG